MVAFLFSVYPDNIFSRNDQWNLVKESKVNKDVLFEGLKQVEAGTTLKLEVFRKNLFSFEGHSLLVKKINENEFIFFDPNTGEHRGLSKEDLEQRINNQLDQWEGTDIFFTKGDDYIKMLKDKNIIEKVKNVAKAKGQEKGIT